MSKDTTTPIPFVSEEDAALTQERLGRLSEPLDAVQGRAQLNEKKHSVLDQISQSLQAYAHENNGAFPSNLHGLQPKYLAELTEELKHVVFLGKPPLDQQLVEGHSASGRPGFFHPRQVGFGQQSLLDQLLHQLHWHLKLAHELMASAHSPCCY